MGSVLQPELAAILPHLADLPARLAALLPTLTQAMASHAGEVDAVNKRYVSRLSERWRQLCAPAQKSQVTARSPTGLPYFEFLRDLHTLQADWCEQYIVALHLPQESARRLRFLLRQWVEARDPDNFPATNAAVLSETLRSQGHNLIEGQRNFSRDAARGRITMSDEAAFSIGRDLAVTPGAVVFENELIQLIRYRPVTNEVYRTPLLAVPPFINKYYVLDLSAHNSFVRYALERGFQVFMISWRNIGEAQGRLTWDDYASQGIDAALQATLGLARSSAVHALGFCVGGTLLSSALASGVGSNAIRSLTLLASLLDFSDVGDIGHYIDEAYAARCEQLYATGGVVPGAQLAAAFASLRPRELVWKFFVSNYLLGTTPAPFDLLHWNSDSANLPGPLFSWYVRELYLNNRLREPGALRINGSGVDLSQLQMPAFVVGTELDHIVPWRSAYASMGLLGGQREFVLGSSGHIAGIVNPPTDSRRHYRVSAGTPPASADAWLTQSTSMEGSWWNHWSEWLSRQDTAKRKAPRQLGARGYPIIEPAPGRYVSATP